MPISSELSQYLCNRIKTYKNMKGKVLATMMMCIALMATAQVKVMNPDDYKAGKAIDKVRYRIHYDMKYVNDTTLLDSLSHYISKTEAMRLDIGEQGITSFYSYICWRSDSIVGEAYKRGERSFQTKGEIGWKLFKHYPKRGEYAWLDGISTERYVCTEKAEEPTWTIVADSTAEVIGNPCQLAVTDFRGRRWYAWYTDDIPISEGPWKLCGLPGLILRAYDEQRQYEFECTGMKPVTQDTAIEYKGEKYDAIDKQTLEKLYRRYYSDPVGYVTSNPNIKVIVKDEYGNQIKMPAKPYNPIER